MERFNRKCNKTADCQLDEIQLLQIALEDIDMSVPYHINIISSFSPAAQLLHCIDSWAALNFYFCLRNQSGSTGSASNAGLYANSRKQP